MAEAYRLGLLERGKGRGIAVAGRSRESIR